MTTTSHLQKIPDFFTSPDECVKAEKQHIQTNLRYKNFDQTHFTAGDIEQFQLYKDPTNGTLCQDIPLKNNIYEDILSQPSIYWEKYKNLNATSVDNTFSYLFHKFKKGIFVKIKNGKFDVFLPFSKKDFINEWGNRIKVDPKYGDVTDFLRHVSTISGYKFYPNSVNKFTDSWYANNCLVRYEFPLHEGDTNNTNASNMFRTLCEERKVPDIEFFVNRRDFPILKTNGTEPYNHIFNSTDFPLLSHNYSKYCPILSMVGSENFADIPIPTGDDWSRVARKEGKYFSKTCNRSFEMINVPWEKRKPTAVFRGGSTGCGVTIDTNVRLKLAYLGSIKENKEFLDAGITEWNLRPRKISGEKYLRTIEVKTLPFGLVPRLTPQQQAEYKYIVNVDGHVSAYRLSLELESGTCILLADSKYKLWYRQFLKPYTHFVPVKEDLEDLIEKIKWCKNHDDECKKISENALEFSKKYLSKNGILDYLQKILVELKKVNGTYIYNFVSTTKIQEEKQMKMLEKYYYPESKKSVDDISIFPKDRTYNNFQGIQWILNMIHKKSNFEKVAKKKVEYFTKNTTITEIDIGGFNFVKKDGPNLVHESFVGSVMNSMLQYIPNFCYNFGYFGKHCFMEHIEGETFLDYLKSDRFNLSEYLLILLQLSLTLHMSQKLFGFVHNDLMPWNIILMRTKNMETIEYIIDYKTVIVVTTQLIPVIIDLGRSHVIHKGEHYGDVHPFQTSTIQDIYTMLISTIYEIINFDMDRKSTGEMIHLANFLKKDSDRFKSIGEIKYNFKSAKKFSEILYSDKSGIQKTPLDLANYIMKYHYNFPVKREDKLSKVLEGNTQQTFDYILSGNSIEEKEQSFYNVFHRVKKCLPDAKNTLTSYYALEIILGNLQSVKDTMLNFLKSVNLKQDTGIKLYDEVVKIARSKYESGDKPEEIKYELGLMNEIHMDGKIFLEPEKMLRELEKYKNVYVTDITDYIDIIEHILLNPMTPKIVKDFYTKNFRDLLSIKIVQYKSSVADMTSFKKISKLLITENLEMLRKQRCSQTENLIKHYDQMSRLV